MFSPVRVVVVDDRPDHLFAIANALAVSGISCIWHLYDNTTHQLSPPPPKGGYSGIRLIVSDLNIREMEGADKDPKNLAGILLSDVLLPILPGYPCSYGLVLWSSVQVKAEEVAEVISERISHRNTPPEERRSAPLCVGLMDKSKFVTVLPSSGAPADLATLLHEAAKNIDAVVQQVNQAMSDTQLRLVCAWESRVGEATASAVNSVHAAAELHSSENQQSPSHGLQHVLAKIAQEAAGRDAREDPVRALDDGLVDLLVDGLRSSDNLGSYRDVLNQSIGDAVAGRPLGLSQQVRYRLNTDLQIETKVSPSVKKIVRGLVLGSADEATKFQEIWQKKLSSVLWDEFLFGVNLFREAADNARNDGLPDADRLSALYDQVDREKPDVEKECRFRLLEIGADCDHAQRKSRTVRLLGALEVPEKFAHFLFRPGGGGGLKSAALLVLGPWVVDGRSPSRLIVSVSRFHVFQDWQLSKDFQPVYRIRKPLVDVVLHKYASHSVRPGYMAIN